MMRKRKNEVRNISAGDFVRSHKNMKLAAEGEKNGKDCTASS
jgi:hypothetical protein